MSLASLKNNALSARYSSHEKQNFTAIAAAMIAMQRNVRSVVTLDMLRRLIPLRVMNLSGYFRSKMVSACSVMNLVQDVRIFLLTAANIAKSSEGYSVLTVSTD